ncbi:hypothetical protein ABT299_00065 [Spirillospora sp. NPDC000708]
MVDSLKIAPTERPEKRWASGAILVLLAIQAVAALWFAIGYDALDFRIY